MIGNRCLSCVSRSWQGTVAGRRWGTAGLAGDPVMKKVRSRIGLFGIAPVLGLMVPVAATTAQSAHPNSAETDAGKGKTVSVRPLVDRALTGYLINRAHGKCLDAVRSHDGTNGDQVQLWSCNSGSNQVWTFQEDITSQIYNGAHGKCLDAVRSHDGTNGDKVQLYSCNDGINQSWQVSGPIRNRAHSKCLDAVRSHDGTNGDKVQLYSCTGGLNQSWSFRSPAQMRKLLHKR
jgi:Ricin-type beta-trefoil lectin domain